MKKAKKAYTFRLDMDLMDRLESVNSNKTVAVTAAIQNYCNGIANNNTGCNTDAIQLLSDQLSFLKGQVTFLQKQNSYLSRPWFQRLLLPKPKE